MRVSDHIGAVQLVPRHGKKTVVVQPCQRGRVQQGHALHGGFFAPEIGIALGSSQRIAPQYPAIGAVALGVQGGAQSAGLQGIVTVQKQNALPAGCIQPRIARRRNPRIGLVDHPDAGILGGKLITKCGACVGAAVVDQQKLPLGVILRKHALGALVQRGGGIVYRRDNAHQTHGITAPFYDPAFDNIPKAEQNSDSRPAGQSCASA